MSSSGGRTPSIAVRECVYGVIIDADRVLLCHSVSGSRIIINFPGGGIDPGESREQALHREAHEEIGTTIVIGGHLHSSDGGHINPDFPQNRLLCHYYLIEPTESPSLSGNSLDVAKLEWFPLDNLPYEHMLDVDEQFARQLKSLIYQAKK